MELNTRLAGVKLKNPIVLASGILGTSASLLKRVELCGAGAVTLKSIGPEERLGHNNPTVISYGMGMLNAVGLPSPGFKNMDEEWKELKQLKVPIIASIYGSSIKEYAMVAAGVAKYRPAMIEINISCPNSEKHGMVFGTCPETSAKVVEAVKNAAGKIPIMPKLTPNCNDIIAVAKACEEAGADAIAAINSVGPGMIIDLEAKKPVLHYKTGGVTGPAIKPIAVRCVYDIYRNVKIPILGIGGITYGTDALEMMMAGASAVGIGSGVFYRGIEIFSLVNQEMQKKMKELGYSKLSHVIGACHD
jgi:dihydroorotate dehydrogenase (NAD+) catalytic subunit